MQVGVYYGVVKGKTVILPDEVQLIEGSVVTIKGPVADLEQVPVALREALFWRYMAETGQIAAPKQALTPRASEDFEPIRVTGKPLSETIIEERR